MYLDFSASDKLRIVLIEDSEVIRLRLAEMLNEIAGVEIVGYADTEFDAIALLRHIGWDVAVLDLQLKTGTGIGVLKSVSQDERPAHSRIVVLTNYAFPQYRERCLLLGADRFFDKSHELYKLRDCVLGFAADNGQARSVHHH